MGNQNAGYAHSQRPRSVDEGEKEMKPIKKIEDFREILKRAQKEHEKQDLYKVDLSIIEKEWHRKA